MPPQVTVPADGERVALNMFFDAPGKPLFFAYAGGPWELRDAAIEAARDLRVQLPRINGAPNLDYGTFVIEFPVQRP